MTSSLISIPKPRHNSRIRLICFPYAGGSSVTYFPFHSGLNNNAELACIQLPGRGVRLSDPPYQSMSDMVNDICSEIVRLPNKANIFLGHSMGSNVAYEVALKLFKSYHQIPIHFIASGSASPSTIRKKMPIHQLSDKEFISEISLLNGAPREIYENDELLRLILPSLRADFRIIETYHTDNKLKLPTNLSVLAGKLDEIHINDIEAWAPLFTSCDCIHWIEGGHFFIDHEQDFVLSILNNIIEAHSNKYLQSQL